MLLFSSYGFISTQANIKNPVKFLVDNFDDKPDIVQEILINMHFNLGHHRLSLFKKFLKAIDGDDWMEAAKEGRDSRWYTQVTRRAERLMGKLEMI